MKKISIIAILLALSILLFSCNEKKDGDSTAEDTTKAEETTKAPEENGVADFQTVKISGYDFTNEGETLSVKEESEGAEQYASSKSSVAEIDENGEILAKKKGVTLIAYEKDGQWSAYVLCVLGEGEHRDRSAGTPTLVEKGESHTMTATVAAEEYFSSDEGVADCTNAPKITFGECGYAVITVTNVSRPFFYSFIVYDRSEG